MATRVLIKRKDKIIESERVFKLLEEFILDSYKGRRTKKNGSRISEGTIRNYTYVRKALKSFVHHKNGDFNVYIMDRVGQRETERVARYYKRFYQKFTNHLYSLGYYDNYVGLIIKCLRSFFNYLVVERNINVGSFHKLFYVPIENIPIIALNPEQLKYIMHDEKFEKRVKTSGLEKVRDIFIFGCCVALRVSDLLALSPKNLIQENDNYYIRVRSLKTKTDTRVKLPSYAIDIIRKYKGKQKTLLPTITKQYLNGRIKDMGKLIEANFEIVKTRERKGKQVVVYKDPKKRTHYTLADHISTHTMRRTAITTMLSLGMPEHLVRKVSGHAANSKEFFRYVEMAQNYIDAETDKVFEALAGNDR